MEQNSLFQMMYQKDPLAADCVQLRCELTRAEASAWKEDAV